MKFNQNGVDLMKEAWKDVKGYEGRYQVSNMGRVKSFAQDRNKGKILKGSTTVKGYLTSTLYDFDGNKSTIPVHRLVASAFIKNPDRLPQINHKDEIKTNNHADNLEWCTNEYNMNYGTRNKRAGESNRCCPTTSKEVYSIDKKGHIEVYVSIGEAERKTGNSHCNIVRTLKGRRPTCGGKRWFYMDD